MNNRQDPYQEGIEAFLTLSYITPINALANNHNKFTKEERFKFAEGFWYAYNFLNNQK
jgi:hypothetical protein